MWHEQTITQDKWKGDYKFSNNITMHLSVEMALKLVLLTAILLHSSTDLSFISFFKTELWFTLLLFDSYIICYNILKLLIKIVEIGNVSKWISRIKVVCVSQISSIFNSRFSLKTIRLFNAIQLICILYCNWPILSIRGLLRYFILNVCRFWTMLKYRY